MEVSVMNIFKIGGGVKPACSKAFTLAETLIVIGIIGVVAALTLPNLNHATGDKEKVTRVKKIYSSLTEALDRAQVNYGDFDTWFKDLSTNADKNQRFGQRVAEYMKVSKDCGFSSGCVSSAPLLLPNGTAFAENALTAMQSQNAYMVTTADGMSIAFYLSNMEGFWSIHQIAVDIDGPNKGKNQMGNDLFNFYIYTEETLASYRNTSGATSANQLYPGTVPQTGTFNLNGNDRFSTAAWVVENGNLDYLKLDSSGNCPDGEALNWGTKTSCN